MSPLRARPSRSLRATCGCAPLGGHPAPRAGRRAPSRGSPAPTCGISPPSPPDAQSPPSLPAHGGVQSSYHRAPRSLSRGESSPRNLAPGAPRYFPPRVAGSPILRRGSVPLLPPLPASPVESERVMVTGSRFSRVWSQPSPRDSGACVGAPAGSARPRTPARSLRSPAPPAAEARAPSPQPRPARAPGPRSSAPSFRRRSSSSRLRGSGRLSRSPAHLPSILLDRARSLRLSHHSFTF